MEFRTTREIVQDMRSMEHGSELKVVLIDVGAQAMQYMHDEKFATARKLFSRRKPARIGHLQQAQNAN